MKLSFTSWNHLDHLPEVVQLPRVGGQVEGVVLSSLSEPAVTGWEETFKDDRLVTGEGRTDDVTADCDVSIGRAGDVPEQKRGDHLFSFGSVVNVQRHLELLGANWFYMSPRYVMISKFFKAPLPP